jgi:hypothetical protein
MTIDPRRKPEVIFDIVNGFSEIEAGNPV